MNKGSCSFVGYPINTVESLLHLARCGFEYTRDHKCHKVKCSLCGGIIKVGANVDETREHHNLLYPNCPLLTNDYYDSGQHTYSPIEQTSELGQLTSDKHKTISSRKITPMCFAKSCNKNIHLSRSQKNTMNVPRQQDLNYQHNHTSESNSLNQIIEQEQEQRPFTEAEPQCYQTPNTSQVSDSSYTNVTTQQSLNSTHFTTEATQQSLNSTRTSTPSNPPHLSSSSANRTNQPSTAPSVNVTCSIARTGPTYSDLGIVTERPKRPEYATRQQRLQTFTSWPRDHHLKPEELVNAGFYFAGYGDCARCFYCGGGLRNWDDEDDVYVEHARWFPKCAFIRGKMGQTFIDVVEDLSKSNEQVTFSMVQQRLPQAVSIDNVSTLLRDPAVQAVVDVGYNEKDVLEAAALLKEQSVSLTADVIVEQLKRDKRPHQCATTLTVTDRQDDSKINTETIREIKERNNQLRQQTVCKICLENEVSVVFLPCGHLVSCSDCSTALKDCPVCRCFIKGFVRAVLN